MDQIILNNRYKLEQRIGVGGMAYVYEAEDLTLKRKVAVKILKQQFVEDAEFLHKFENEALSAAALNHPNIVNVYDVGSDTVNGMPMHYIVMELIEGTTLKDAIASQGPMSDAVIARTAEQIAKALLRAHEHNIVHRDVKPANILIMKTGDVKVADFGIARITSSSTITYTNSILGTVHYISPEQAKGRIVDHKSDLYSLGVVMYEMATGKVPFDGENSVSIAIKHIQEYPRPPIEINEALSPGLNRIILKLMEKNPEDRYDSAQELIDDLHHYQQLDEEDFASYSDATEKVSRVQVYEPEVTYESRYDAEEYEEEPKKNRKLLFYGLLTALAIVFLILLAFFFMNRTQKKAQDAMTTVPTVTNLSEKEALSLLESKELVGKVVDRVNDDTVQEGYVIDQSIVSGTSVEKGTTVNLRVSTGKGNMTVPDVKNKTLEAGRQILTDAGFKLGSNQFEYDENVAKDQIIGTNPETGTSVAAGTRVSIILSLGPKKSTTRVPVLLNKTQAEAMSEITTSHLKLGNFTAKSSSYPSGTVIEQSIEPGAEVDIDTTIDIVVSSGPEPEQSVAKPKTTIYNLKFYPPADKTSFEVTVFDRKKSTTEPIYRKTFTSADFPAEGYISASVEADEEAELLIYYDGVPADISSGTNGQ
ncbi:MAG: Stk1 family PASTA domain-containing Ser/Thr kinase [Peptoniphilaceae bacterium]|nr:Stk1 family PASTA domain-containing Ser/Thr kinase [Peptoniphilaceae bacterium]MDY5765610.1 Stk1 family PASTA domain-containing Ser/Thr kinase [Peptoniphilaceae bacterium]